MGAGELVSVRVTRLARDQRGTPVVLLQPEGESDSLPIWIGHTEAMAIELYSSGRAFERPLTHDLLRLAIESLGARVARVTITELRDSTYLAKVYLQREDDVFVIDARPSDSIALALASKAEILVDRELFAQHKRAIPEATDPSSPDDDIERHLRDLDPGQF